MYKILISNDDGVKGAGLRPLIKEMSKIGKVFVIVPFGQMSGTGHSITLSKFKKAIEIEKNFYAIKGATPADCVKFGLLSFKDVVPDIVISGINTCPNMGQDVIYSGTCGAAREGAMKGIPSLAVSAAEMHAKEYRHSAQATRKIAEKVLKNKKKYQGVCLNINIPKNYKGIKVVPLGLNEYNESVETVLDKNGYFHYKLSGRYHSGGKNKGSDIAAVEKGYISVTPLQIDQTNFSLMKKIKL
ncbi:5'/3'-nucleotidase SurE [Endomicrobium proavitum]|uniref:5'-nucleotidase SurE n=1 Tax=Endomicrobium proavitum TaxID=1408281 RepID=A0A0G3WGA4_9BACT|nr:5'/3'-nucleotidase SurE [Endomicrobium proavitum]AKL97681.1 5-nucleotidase SurE [Endomicrobium proavitum]